HSMCHPGLPLPHGLSHVGDSSENFHRAKSSGSFFVSSTSTLAPDTNSSIFFLDSFPYSANFDTEKYTPFLEVYANPFSIKPFIKFIMSEMCSVALGYKSALFTFSLSKSSKYFFMYLVVMVSANVFSFFALLIILSSTSV